MYKKIMSRLGAPHGQGEEHQGSHPLDQITAASSTRKTVKKIGI